MVTREAAVEDRELRAWARVAAEGDLDAAEKLIRGLHAHLHSFLHLLGVPERDIDDVAQDVTLTMYRGLARYDSSEPFLPWLRGIARNVVATYWRGSARYEARLGALRQRVSEELERDERAWCPELDRLKACVSKLQQRQRTIVERHYFDGETSSVIAKALGIGASAIRKALMGIRAALRKCVEETREATS